MTTHVNDGGTWRNITSVYVNDGGTWRTIRQIYVNDAGTWRTVFTSSVSFSLAADVGTDGIVYDFIGYANSPVVGSLTPTGTGALPGGVNFDSLLDYYGVGGGGYNFSQVQMSGFGADPGKTGFFSSIDIETDDGPKNYTSASANGDGGAIPGYSYSSGTATWTWNTEFDLNGIADPHDVVINF